MRFTLEVLDYMYEMAAFMYFGIRLLIGKFDFEVSIYKAKNGMLLFRVHLPLFHITNTMYQKVITEPGYATDGPVMDYFRAKRSKVVNLVSWSVFGWRRIPETATKEKGG